MWKEYRKEASDHIGHTDEWKEIYLRREETIESCFVDAKIKYGIGFTRYCGKQKVLDDVYLFLAAVDMKKMVNYL